MATQVTRPKMTAEEATTFETISPTNAAILMEAARAKGCQCMPYADWFTFKRWQAQAMQVQRGEHGTRVMTLIPVTDKKSGEVVGRRPWSAVVFCRCQVKPSEGGQS